MKPKVLLACAVFAEVTNRLAQHFEVESNPLDALWGRDERIDKLQDKAGVLTPRGKTS